MRGWLPYIDDFCVRTGRWRQGAPITDEEHAALVSAAVPAPPACRPVSEALKELGAEIEGLWDGPRPFDPVWPSPYAQTSMAARAAFAAVGTRRIRDAVAIVCENSEVCRAAATRARSRVLEEGTA